MIRFALKRLMKTEPSERTFEAKVTTLREIVEHHMEKEEDELFSEGRDGARRGVGRAMRRDEGALRADRENRLWGRGRPRRIGRHLRERTAGVGRSEFSEQPHGLATIVGDDEWPARDRGRRRSAAMLVLLQRGRGSLRVVRASGVRRLLHPHRGWRAHVGNLSRLRPEEGELTDERVGQLWSLPRRDPGRARCGRRCSGMVLDPGALAESHVERPTCHVGGGGAARRSARKGCCYDFKSWSVALSSSLP